MNTFTETIESRKRLLEEHLGGFMGRLAEHCARGWGIRERLDQALLQSLQENDHIAASRLLYIVDINGVQLSSNIFSTGEVDESRVGQDLSARPYISTVLPSDGFFLSDVYISQRNRRSLVTAVQLIRIGEVVKGFVCVDFELGMLPEVGQPTEDRRIWMQVKGDPSIRNTLFMQSRAISPMDDRIDDVMSIVDELMVERGIFHAKLHFSSSRATLWLFDDPYRYRVHVLDEILNPSVCLAYPLRGYPQSALVPADKLRLILDRFKWLRQVDETIYLRAASINIINGIVALNFSCDGSHYLPYEEFLEMDERFWFGTD
ncbi:MAG: hypothetical protein HN842_01510 [Gammaproteobacteria bacterium]|jgi:hypothetical protein|nr:hypothetical protein [Gammaproteobacteria bacterium]